MSDDLGPTTEPFTVALADEVMTDLRRRLRTTRWPGDLGNDTWTYGVEQRWLQDMARYWAEEWDWAAQAAAMNRFDHHMTTIDDIAVHFLRRPGSGPAPMPLVLTHGWPWTFWDFADVVEPLADPAGHGGDAVDAFDVVVPSLPGFGFSTPLAATGIDVRRIADLWVRLMTDGLGYERFAAHGGDWGSIVTAELGHAHADAMIGVHMTLPVLPGLNRRDVPPETFADDEEWMLTRTAEARPLITSHLAVHTTDPQTLAYAMADSPLGTAAWIWERRRNWSDCDGDVESVFDRDHLCTTATLYWATGAIASSLRLYFEHFRRPYLPRRGLDPVIAAPSGYAIFPKELVFLPRSVVEAHTDLRRWTVMPRGGHFGGAEQPALLVEELREFFRPLR